MIKKTSVDIEENVWKEAKKHCIDVSKDISKYIEELIKKDLKLK